jgi:hypothetical protein
MWISFDIEMCTKIDINISHMEMIILEYLSRDLNYAGEEMFMCMRGQWKFPLYANHAIMQTYNKMHSGFKVHVKWGIGGFHPTKRKHSHLFQTSVGRFSPVRWKPPESVFSSKLMMRTVMRTFLAVLIGDENRLMRTTWHQIWEPDRFWHFEKSLTFMVKN